jgi:hypothetical protein
MEPSQAGRQRIDRIANSRDSPDSGSLLWSDAGFELALPLPWQGKRHFNRPNCQSQSLPYRFQRLQLESLVLGYADGSAPRRRGEENVM